MRSVWLSAVVAMLASCESAPGPGNGALGNGLPQARRGPELRDRVQAHHGAASELQLAIVHGRLTDARDLASWIATNATPRTDALVAAARRIADADDVTAMAELTGQLAGACGTCHLTREVTPAYTFGALPANDASIEGQMHRHAWAAARLWEGVTGPADGSWRAGANAMLATSIDIGATTHAKPNADVVGFAETMHEVATRALDTEELSARAELLGETLKSCAGCHGIVRPRAIARASTP